MPLDVAVEQPHARVVGAEPHHHIAVGPHHQGVAAHGHGGEGDVARGVEDAGVVAAAPDGLEGVPVQVERVLTRVVVVDDDVDDLVLREDEGVRELAVDAGVGGGVAAAEGGEEGGDLGGLVGDVVEEGAGERLARHVVEDVEMVGGRKGIVLVGSVVEDVHDDLEDDGLVGSGEEWLFVVWHEAKVIEFVEFIQ